MPKVALCHKAKGTVAYALHCLFARAFSFELLVMIVEVFGSSKLNFHYVVLNIWILIKNIKYSLVAKPIT
jgi:hypothetical protein